MFKQATPFVRHLRGYFHAYGGWSAVFASPFFIVALVVASISYSSWMHKDWTETSKSLIPNLLGFSLGTYSIIFSLVTSRIKRAMKASVGPSGSSRLEEVNATFFHFILVQVTALLWAFVYQGTLITDILTFASHNYCAAIPVLHLLRFIGSFFGYLLLIYSFLLILGAALAVYRLALIVDPKDD